jgi:hypothetical protein
MLYSIQTTSTVAPVYKNMLWASNLFRQVEELHEILL